ncbi:MAG: indole-3-glycerol phosphate synthase TrpC, partial [Chloroflexota bacterium]|nr:indole-3-glycerol phosphate synthase TrpC [Chloroflexota bacterium]
MDKDTNRVILDEILTHKREELRQRQQDMPLGALHELAAALAPPRPFRDALTGARVRVIAEVKRRSPSRGLLVADLDPARTAVTYANHGAAAISVLTDEQFFGGSLADLQSVRRAVDLPILRKDFVLNGYQIVEARAYGADAVLLIAAALDADDLNDLLEETRVLGMDALVEVHTEEEMDLALDCGAPLIGINNRDLQTFTTDLEITRSLAPLVPDGHVLVSES